MCNRVLQITVSVTLVLMLFSSGFCAILSLHKNDTACQKGSSPDALVSTTISGLCKIALCSINNNPLFALPDLSLRRLETERFSVQHHPNPVSVSSEIAALPNNQMMKDALKIPLSFSPLPVFYLNCTMIC
jgi:hypothetical protein